MPGPKERDLETTRRSLERWLAGRLGGADSVALSPLKGPSDTGFSSDTLLFDATWRRGDEERVERLVARIEPRGFNVFPSYDVAVQFRVMRALGDTQVPVPRMRWLEEDAAILGAPFYVMDRVDGRVPSDSPPYATGGWVSELSAAEQARLWWSGLEAMARVHTLDWRALGLSFLAGPEGPETPISRQLRYYEEFFCWGVEDPGRYPLLERSMAWLREHAPAEEPVALCWGDSRLGNQIFHGLECVAVIDWEMVRIGNPVQDLAWWIALDRCFSESLGVPRISGFPDAEQTIARWESWTGIEACHFDYYRLLALMKFSVIMARIGLQMKHYGVMPPEADFDVENLASMALEKAMREIIG